MRWTFGFQVSILVLMTACGTAWAAPVLNFSDITSGPKSGLGDGLGAGAIVTIWGNGLGDLQSGSKVRFRDSAGNLHDAAYVYYWKKADGQLPGGPARLTDHQFMQEVAFSIPAAAADGAGSIFVTVGNSDSNSLPYTVRPGNIRHVKTSGSNAAAGTWASPWQTLNYVGNSSGKVVAGDIVYVGDGVAENAMFIIKTPSGTDAMPVSIVAYPGARVVAQGATTGISNWTKLTQYWNFSKIIVRTGGLGISAFKGMRAVGNEITNLVGGCADGQSGAISGSNTTSDTTGAIKCFGNYIHDFGCDTTNKLHHVFYLSNRSGITAEAFELGWNYLKDNKAHYGLHVFDEGVCGDLTGTLKIHDNVVENQVAAGFDISSGGVGACFSMPVEVFNNLFINCGQEVSTCSGHDKAIVMTRDTNQTQVKFYNNTIVGYGDNVRHSGAAFYVQGSGSASWIFGGTWEFVNNIIVDTNNLPFEDPNYFKAADIHSNNLWFNGDDGIPTNPPAWDTAPRTSDPKFTNPASGMYTMQQGSPAINSGFTTSVPGLSHDLRGAVRSAPHDIGAYEYSEIKSISPPFIWINNP